jgi:peptidoglycan/LPS O-acetylase OafA/YrhL
MPTASSPLIFFLISGFIFFWLYKNRVADGSLSVIEFWVLRISHLYPLHVVTLLFVAHLQVMFHRQTGQYFIYGANNPIHFVKSLFFFQLNGDGAAFNGPTWSVTVELVMYVLFCLTAWMGLLKYGIVPALLFVVGLFLYSKHQNIAMGICGFFEGGLLYITFERIIASSYKKKMLYTVQSYAPSYGSL